MPRISSYCTFAFVLLSILSTLSRAQAQIPQGASFWLRADTGVTAVNGAVTDWKDQSGSTKSAFQTQPVSEPTLIPASINNLPAVHFEGRFTFMDCAPIFPTGKDYSVTIVTRLLNVSYNNHLFSGNRRSIYAAAGTGLITVRNDTLPAPAVVSNLALAPNTPSIVTISYRQANQTAAIYVNGTFADSAFIGPNEDSRIYLGAFQGLSSFAGDLAEIVLYTRVLTRLEREQLEGYLFDKYAVLPTPAPDSIYTAVPKHFQLYPREQDDSATVRIAGNIYETGYDSIYLKFFKDGILLQRTAEPLQYVDGKAAFNFSSRIHAELAEYSFLLGIKYPGADKQIAFRDSVVCGDVFLIDGQTNAINNNLGYTNQFFRTFGLVYSQDPKDTVWAISSAAISMGGGTEVGSWGVRLQEQIMNTYHIPTCIINGAIGGATIGQFGRDDLNPTNLNTIYGAMLYRAQKSNLASAAKALFWYEGESDELAGYQSSFTSIFNSWKQDYPNLRKIYMMQIRPGCSTGFTADLRDLQRRMPDLLPNLEIVSTTAIQGHDGCTFSPEGYTQLGDELFRLVARDFYGASDINQISSPNIVQAFYTNSAHTGIGLTFSPEDTRFTIPADTTVNGIAASLKDYFLLDDSAEVVQSISTSWDRIFLELKQPSSATSITYLPDKYYNNSSVIYEGPWLVNSRGIGALSFYHVPIVDSAQATVPMNANNGGNGLEVFPNPSDGRFTVRYYLSVGEDALLCITDLLGRTIFLKSISTGSSQMHEELFDISRSMLVTGPYICSVRSKSNAARTMLYLK
ncbi:MAG: sialate O-acetylesterase [Bacteroidota bacterium]|nr:sialate O-acetylesterase [Bacteroidota bacterium]